MFYGPVPGSVYAGHRLIDVLIHGWDLATATGQDATLDPELVDAAYRLLREQADMVRASMMFGEDLPCPPECTCSFSRSLVAGAEPHSDRHRSVSGSDNRRSEVVEGRVPVC